MAISKRLRYEVLRRDGHRCRYCGITADEARLAVDHVTPVALGGTDEPGNLVASCEPCNSGKTSSSPDAPLVDEVREDAVRWARAMETAAETALAERQVVAEYRGAFLDSWPHHEDLPAGWALSVDRFRACGLPIRLLADAVEATAGTGNLDDPFRYLCGIAWCQIRQLQDQARRLVEDSEPDDDCSDIDEIWDAALAAWQAQWLSRHESAPSEQEVDEARKRIRGGISCHYTREAIIFAAEHAAFDRTAAVGDYFLCSHDLKRLEDCDVWGSAVSPTELETQGGTH